MSTALVQKIEMLSPEDQQEVEKFVAFLHFRSTERDSILNEAEEAEIHQRLFEMKQYVEASIPAQNVFAELRAKYGR
jgi:hypothetical protein